MLQCGSHPTSRPPALIIDRYLTREITKPLLLVCVILLVIFTGFSASLFLADAAQGLIGPDIVGLLVLLKSVIGLETMLPPALYLAVIVGLGRFHSDSEMAALSAAGISEPQILWKVLRLAFVIALVVAVLSWHVRPWAHRMIYELEVRALAELDISKLEAGRFYRLGQTDYVIFADDIDREQARLEGVFFQGSSSGEAEVIQARQAYLSHAADDGETTMIFLDGYGHIIDQDSQRDLSLDFGVLTLYLSDVTNTQVGYKRRAESTLLLAESDHPGDIAEFQWRMSMPLLTLLLAAMAVPMSRTPPRKGRFARSFAALVAFTLYYNLVSVGRTWVDQGHIPALPGLWWVHLLPVLVVGYLVLSPGWSLRAARRRPAGAGEG